FTDRRDVVGQLFANRAATRVRRLAQRLDVFAALLQRHFGHRANEVLELFVLGHEIGFRVDLDGYAARTVDGHADQAFGGGAARLLGSSREAAGAQRVDRGFEITARFVEGLLAVHHAGAGALAQVLHVRGGISSHCRVLLSYEKCRTPTDLVRGPAIYS